VSSKTETNRWSMLDARCFWSSAQHQVKSIGFRFGSIEVPHSSELVDVWIILGAGEGASKWGAYVNIKINKQTERNPSVCGTGTCVYISKDSQTEASWHCDISSRWILIVAWNILHFQSQGRSLLLANFSHKNFFRLTLASEAFFFDLFVFQVSLRGFSAG
jgi:hypothetical protein